MGTNVNKTLRSIERWNVFESYVFKARSCSRSGFYKPVFPFPMTLSEAKSSAEHFRLLFPSISFVVLPYGCSF